MYRRSHNRREEWIAAEIGRWAGCHVLSPSSTGAGRFCQLRAIATVEGGCGS
jgi:hypothetical protein